MQDLNDFIIALKEIRTKQKLKVTDKVLFEQACTYHRQSLINKQGKSFSERKPPLNSPATEKQKNLLKKMKIQFNENISKKEASKLIDSKLK